MIGNHEKSSSMEGQVLLDRKDSFMPPMEGRVLLDRKSQITPLMEGRILFDRGRVKLAPPTSTLLLTILFIFLFSPLFPLSAQENDNEVNVKKAPVNQNGIMETPLEEAKAFVADEVKADGSAPERIIKLSKLFKPFGDLKFRPFRDYEVVKNQIDIARHPRRDPIIPRDKILDWKFWGKRSYSLCIG